MHDGDKHINEERDPLNNTTEKQVTKQLRSIMSARREERDPTIGVPLTTRVTMHASEAHGDKEGGIRNNTISSKYAGSFSSGGSCSRICLTGSNS